MRDPIALLRACRTRAHPLGGVTRTEVKAEVQQVDGVVQNAVWQVVVLVDSLKTTRGNQSLLSLIISP